MSIVTGVFSVKCKRCEEQHDFSPDEADFEVVSADERQMGTERQYAWEIEIDCECGNSIEVSYNVWEYPEGSFNTDDVRVTGGEVVRKFDYDFHEQPDEEEDY